MPKDETDKNSEIVDNGFFVRGDLTRKWLPNDKETTKSSNPRFLTVETTQTCKIIHVDEPDFERWASWG